MRATEAKWFADCAMKSDVVMKNHIFHNIDGQIENEIDNVIDMLNTLQTEGETTGDTVKSLCDDLDMYNSALNVYRDPTENFPEIFSGTKDQLNNLRITS